MRVEKTIVCKIVEPNKGKLETLQREYEKTQKYIKGKDVGIYSATKQAMDKYVEKDKLKDKEYPWFLRNDTFEVGKSRNARHFGYWARIPVKDAWGKIDVPIKPHESIEKDYHIHDSKIVRNGQDFELHLSVSKEVEPESEYDGVLGVDLGLRKLAVSVSLPDRQTQIYGSEVSDVQARFYFLRKNCRDGYTRRKWDNRDKNIVNDICHQVSRRIVNYAEKHSLAIALGSLEGVQRQKKGRKMNRKLHNFPQWKLRNYIKYKAKWEGIEVVEVSEAYTSQRCSRCGEMGDRNKGVFKCSNCGLETDSDKNGAHNISKRAFGKFLETSSECRGIVTMPETTTVDQTSGYSTLERQVCEVGGNP